MDVLLFFYLQRQYFSVNSFCNAGMGRWGAWGLPHHTGCMRLGVLGFWIFISVGSVWTQLFMMENLIVPTKVILYRPALAVVVTKVWLKWGPGLASSESSLSRTYPWNPSSLQGGKRWWARQVKSQTGMAVFPYRWALHLYLYLSFHSEASADQSVTGSSSVSVCKGGWWPVANYTFDELVVKTMPHVSSPSCKLPGYWRVSCVDTNYA